MRIGTVGTYQGLLAYLQGKRGLITAISPNKKTILVRFDYDGRERVVEPRHFAPKENNDMNIKSVVLGAVTTLLKPLNADSVKEQAVRRLGVASELVRLGEADKKKAKTELVNLGIITGGEQDGVIFDTERYVMTAKTRAASSRLDAAALDAALAAEPGLSAAARRRIVSAATIVNKAAVSFSIETK